MYPQQMPNFCPYCLYLQCCPDSLTDGIGAEPPPKSDYQNLPHPSTFTITDFEDPATLVRMQASALHLCATAARRSAQPPAQPPAPPTPPNPLPTQKKRSKPRHDIMHKWRQYPRMATIVESPHEDSDDATDDDATDETDDEDDDDPAGHVYEAIRTPPPALLPRHPVPLRLRRPTISAMFRGCGGAPRTFVRIPPNADREQYLSEMRADREAREAAADRRRRRHMANPGWRRRTRRAIVMWWRSVRAARCCAWF